MPSIAQQVYLRASGKSLSDCHLYAALAHNLKQGTIFDTIIRVIINDRINDARAILIDQDRKFVYYYHPINGAVVSLSVIHSQTQYEGLAAIQDAGAGFDVFPVLAWYANTFYLIDDNSSEYITSGGKVIKVTVDDDNMIVSLEKTEVSQSGYDISWEDAQKLIGLSGFPVDE